jgi:hypothetical protein
MPGVHHVKHKLSDADRAAAHIAREHKREAERALREVEQAAAASAPNV